MVLSPTPVNEVRTDLVTCRVEDEGLSVYGRAPGAGYGRIFLAYALLDMALRGLGGAFFSLLILCGLWICCIMIPSAYIALLLPPRL